MSTLHSGSRGRDDLLHDTMTLLGHLARRESAETAHRIQATVYTATAAI